MKLRFVYIACSLLLFAAATGARAQCNIQFDAGADAVLCQPGPLNVSATITGQFLDFRWLPTALFTNATQASTQANITQSTDLVLEVRTLVEPNLIANGDFSQGDVGFTSDYIYGTGGQFGPISSEGQYFIGRNSVDAHRRFANCGDHTGSNGNMMVVNASGQPDRVWCQQITVKTQTDYDFSAWLMTAADQNPARLHFSINGAMLGQPVDAPPTTCLWKQVRAQWNSGNTTQAEICIVNVNATPFGNDFALDDLSFREICARTDTLRVEIADLHPDIDVPTTVCTGLSGIDLGQYLLATATAGGEWTLDGQPIGTLNTTNLSLGSHDLEYTVRLGNCEESQTASFTLVPAPNAGMSGLPPSVCEGENRTIDLAGQLLGADAGGRWENASQLPVPPTAFNATTGSLTTTTLAAGAYRFYYIVSGSGQCTPDTATLSLRLTEAPTADAGADVTLDCDTPTNTLGGQTTTVGGGITYAWYQDGTLIPGYSERNYPVAEAGRFELVVTDNNSGCLSRDEVVVTSQINEVAVTLTPEVAGCDDPNSGRISVTASGGLEPYVYGLENGILQANPVISGLAPGDYTVIVQDAAGCESSVETTLAAPDIITAQLVTSGETTVDVGKSILLQLLIEGDESLIDSIVWEPSLPENCGAVCTEAEVRPFISTRYTATIYDRRGCSTSAGLLINVNNRLPVFIPNVFSPNNDGQNDRFYIQADPAILTSIHSFIVLDRWGNAVYERMDLAPNDPDNGWDGSARNQALPTGIYVFCAELEWVTGEISSVCGEISLVR